MSKSVHTATGKATATGKVTTTSTTPVSLDDVRTAVAEAGHELAG
ncbi:hypothetical protein AB0E59_11920 [Lentzea sp. NPDC034063]